VVKVVAHPFGLQRGGVGALEKDDVVRGEGLLDRKSGKEAWREGDLADEAPEILGRFAVGYFHCPLRDCQLT
jgi:hypothetical protein